MDYRLFVLNGEIYLHANADTAVVTKLSLRAKGFGDTTVAAGSIHDKVKSNQESMNQPHPLQNLFGGDHLQVTVMHQFNAI